MQFASVPIELKDRTVEDGVRWEARQVKLYEEDANIRENPQGIMVVIYFQEIWRYSLEVKVRGVRGESDICNSRKAHGDTGEDGISCLNRVLL